MTITDEIRCIEREIKLRENFYPRWINAGRMTEGKADHEIRCMKAILERLHEVESTELLL